MKIAAMLAMVLLMANIALGSGAEGILGRWKTEQDESLVEIYSCGEKLCGKVVWLKEPFYTNIKDGPLGTPLVDSKNPDPALRGRPIIGLRIMEGFSEIGENRWGNGTCYDPKSGNTYRGRIRLVSPQRLELRGYVGIPLFGRTAVWTR